MRVLVLSDSCHSGTVIRDAVGRVRGLTDTQKAMICEHRRAEYTAIQRVAKAGGKPAIKANVLLMSACQDDQTASDGDENGEFTGTLLMVLDHGRFQGSYRDFHQAILDEMPSDQTPNLFRLGPTDEAFEALRPFTFYAGQKSSCRHPGGMGLRLALWAPKSAVWRLQSRFGENQRLPDRPSWLAAAWGPWRFGLQAETGPGAT